MTLAERYNAEAHRLMPQHAKSLAVDPSINNAGHIDEIVFRRSEYLGGMAAVLLAQIAVQIGTDEWAHTYVHFDGYPSHMLPALAHWTPEEILAAKEIRQVTVEGLDSFEAPRAPIVYPEPRCDFCHTYVFAQGGWIEWRAGQ